MWAKSNLSYMAVVQRGHPAGTAELATGLFHDETSFATLEIVTASLALALIGLAAFREISVAVASVVYRIQVLLTLPVR